MTIGETMVLFTAESDGRLRYATRFERSCGGAESNFAIAFARLGLRAGWVSRLGDDEFGAYLLSFMRGEGVDVSRVVLDGERPTGVFFKEKAVGGDAKVFYYRHHDAACALSPADLDRDYIAGARHLHLTGITLALSPSCEETVVEAMRIARAAGVPVSFDCNVRLRLWGPDRWRQALERCVALSDLLFVTQEEAKLLCGATSPEEAVSRLMERGPREVVVKLGSRGAWVATASEAFHQPAEPVASVVNSHGAGDAFAAGLVGGRLLGWDTRRSARLGAILGATATTVTGNIEGLLTLREVTARLGGADSPLR